MRNHTKKLSQLENQLQEEWFNSLIRAGTSDTLFHSDIEYRCAWYEMLIACREGLQRRIDLMNQMAQLNDDYILYVDKVNAIWNLLQDVMAIGILNIMELDLEPRFTAIQAMPDMLKHEKGKVALDVFFPRFTANGKDAKHFNTPEYQRFLGYLDQLVQCMANYDSP